MRQNKFFAWKNDYNLGVETIDNQHKELVLMIDKLYFSVIEQQADQISRNILNKMAEYAVFHFDTEENVFSKCNYSLVEEHINEHRKFIEKVAEFKSLSDKNLPVTFQIISFIKDWLTEHILSTDKNTVECLKKQGLLKTS